MACNICGGKVEECQECFKELNKSEFKCHREAHFCSEDCWKKELIENEACELEDAKDDGA